MHEPLILIEEHSDHVTQITLNRPEKRNALSIDLMRELCIQWDRLEESSCRVVVLAGAGQVFCAGLDLKEASIQELAEESASWVSRTFKTVSNANLVTIAAVHGAAFAGGAGLMAACDYVVASDNLSVCFPEVRRGLVPALVTPLLYKRVSASALRELLLLAEPVDACRALQIGLVDRVLPDEYVLEHAYELAHKLKFAAPQATRMTKQLLQRVQGLSAAESWEYAMGVHQQARQSDEAKEGLAAFLEQRHPRWKD